MILHALAKNWGFLALRGVAALLFGVLTILMPGVSLIGLVYLFGIYALFDGFLYIAAAFRSGSFWAMLLGGVVSVVAGILAFVRPELTALSLLFLIAAWAIVTGVLSIVTGIRLRKELDHEWYLILTGAISVGFGCLVIAAPGAGALALALWIGAYAFVMGIILIVLAFRLRSIDHHLPGAAAHPV